MQQDAEALTNERNRAFDLLDALTVCVCVCVMRERV